jgi:hypothetical protein
MRILSIDVGIKNLAHCLLDVKVSLLDLKEASLSLAGWEVVDLTNPVPCACGKKALHQVAGQTYCKKHAPAPPSVAGLALPALQALCAQHGVDAAGDRKTVVARFKQATKLEKIKTASQLQDTAISIALTAHYDRLFTEKVDTVLIENQLAARMKPLQGMLIQYWTMKGAKVQIVSPTNKLKFLNMGDTTYAQRKKLGVEHTRRLLAEHKLAPAVFEASKKKDDLADAFLQGVWYIREVLKVATIEK